MNSIVYNQTNGVMAIVSGFRFQVLDADMNPIDADYISAGVFR